jgi:hypothetical protein
LASFGKIPPASPYFFFRVTAASTLAMSPPAAFLWLADSWQSLYHERPHSEGGQALMRTADPDQPCDCEHGEVVPQHVHPAQSGF